MCEFLVLFVCFFSVFFFFFFNDTATTEIYTLSLHDALPIFSFSYKPLRLGLALGTAVLSVSLLMAMLLLTCSLFGLRFMGFRHDSGASSILFAILVLGGIQLVCTGLLGEYIGRIYDEVRRRPMYIVHKLHQALTVPSLESEVIPDKATVRVQVGSTTLTPV